MPLLRRTVEHDVPLLLGELSERNIRADSHVPGDVLHQGPHQGLPGGHRALVDGLRLVRNEGGLVDLVGYAGAVAFPAGSCAVERELLRAGRRYYLAAYGASYLEHRGEVYAGLQVVSVGASVMGQPREHQPHAVQELRRSAERAPYPGNSGTLVQRKSRRNVADVVHIGAGSLGHAPAGVRREGFEIASGSFGVERAKSQRRLP